MPSHIEELRKRAKKNPKKIILPEGDEIRVLKAARKLISLGIAEIILIGKEELVKKKAKESSVLLNNVQIIEPEKYPKCEELIDLFYSLRSPKGVTKDQAREIVLRDPVYFGALLVRLGVADGFVAGASHTTSNVARGALYCLGLDEAIGVMSSSFVIELESSSYGDNGLFIFGDCGIVPNPTADRLATIAISSSRLYTELFKRKPRVALLSYSTKGSAKGESVEKVLKSLKIIKEKAPDLMVDGELQLDAAIIPEVARIKAPESSIAGQANTLIFPNLDAGNIACKLIQRLGKARVVGPILHGLIKPCSDLSRGCGIEEIVDAAAVIVIRAQQC